jgi:hypothetical protein
MLPATGSARAAAGLALVADASGLVRAFAADTTERYQLQLARSSWLQLSGELGYVCRSLDLTQVFDLTTGAVLREAADLAGSPCAEPLVAP